MTWSNICHPVCSIGPQYGAEAVCYAVHRTATIGPQYGAEAVCYTVHRTATIGPQYGAEAYAQGRALDFS